MAVGGDADGVAVGEIAGDQFARQGVLEHSLNRAAQRPGAVLNVRTLLQKERPGLVVQLERQIPVRKSFVKIPQLDVHDLLEFRLAERMKDDNLIDAVEKFRSERGFKRLLDVGLDLPVIATGGGAPIRQENQEFFENLASTFYLEVSYDAFLNRTGKDHARPLLDRTEKGLKRLYESRLSIYRSLGRSISTNRKKPEEIAVKIWKELSSCV